MEIRPYRSQVRSTPTLEPVNNTVPNAGYAYQAFGDMISKTGQGASTSMYKWNKAIQQRRDQDDDMALKAICQDIDQRFLDFGNETNKFFENDANDPNKIFYSDKSSYDQFYQNGITSIQVNTVDKVQNPRVQEAARLYFNQKKMAAGQGFLETYNNNKKTAGALIFGREMDDKVQKAVFADYNNGDTPEAHMADIEATIQDMARHGYIRQDEIQDYVKNAEQRILYGRARNIIPTLDYMAGKKYLQQLTKAKTLDDKTRKAVEDYFDEYWRHEADMMNQTAADTFHNDIQNVENLTEDGIRNNPAYKQMPQIGVRNDYADTLIGILNKREAHAKAERQNGQIEFYFQQLYNPDSDMYGDYDGIEKSVIDNPDLDTDQKEGIIKSINGFKKVKDNERYLNTYKKYYNYKFGGGDYDPEKSLAELNKDLEKGDIDQSSAEHWANIFTKDMADGVSGKKSQAEIEWGDNYYMYHMAEYYEILNSENAVPEEKEKLYGEFCKRYYVPPEKYNSLLNNLKNAYVNPRLISLIKMFDAGMAEAAKKKDVAKYDLYKSAANSLYETIFTDTSNPDGTPLSKPERDRKIDLALDVAQKFLDGERLDELASQQFLPNNPVFIAKEDGDYDVDIGADWTTLRDVAERASLLRYTDEGKEVLGQFKAMCSKMISGATGEYQELGSPVFKGDEVRFEAGVRYYKDQDGNSRRYVNKIYTIKLNRNGNINIFETRHDGAGEVTDLAVPYIVKRQWGVEAEENVAFKSYQENIRANQNAGIDIEKANRAYEEAPDEYKTGMAKVEHERLNR